MPQKTPITVIDDEPGMCAIVTRILEANGYEVLAFTDSRVAADHIRRERPNIVLTDVKMPDISGLEILQLALQANHDAAVIVATAFGSIEDSVEAMQKGAFYYITKPWQMDDLLNVVGQAAQQISTLFENQQPATSNIPTATYTETDTSSEDATGLAGTSAAISHVRDRVMRAAPTDMTVLITGETGTGKELVARAIHTLSHRHKNRFVPINCASLSATLLESELFGYEKGAFTGADKQKIGLVEIASGGTLFLDEIGEMSRELQARLLRTLQEREVQRIGGNTPIPVDLRVVAATNRNLREEVHTGQFREDLYHRINGISVKVPPLRERPEDIAVLAELFLNRIAKKHHRRPLKLSADAQQWLQEYNFPGNVRELQNMMERATVLCDGTEIDREDMSREFSSSTFAAVTAEDMKRAEDAKHGAHATNGTTETDYRKARESWEQGFFARLIKSAQGNMTKAAQLAGMSRRNLYEKIEKLGIKDDQKK